MLKTFTTNIYYNNLVLWLALSLKMDKHLMALQRIFQSCINKGFLPYPITAIKEILHHQSC